jgi:hypothetical protein
VAWTASTPRLQIPLIGSNPVKTVYEFPG